MAMEEPESNTGRRTRVGESGAPIGSALSIVLAVVAAVLGFFILRQISDEGGTSAGSADTGETSFSEPSDDPSDDEDGEEPENGDETTPSTTEAPQERNVFQGAQVIVANGAREGGIAGDFSDQLAILGFQRPDNGAAINASGDAVIEQTAIYFRPRNDNAEAVAETVRRAFGDQSIPIESFSPDGTPVNPDEFNAAVVVVVGADHTDTELQEPPDPSTEAPEPGQDGGGGDGGDEEGDGGGE